MDIAEKEKLKHDFFNSVAIITSLTDSASKFFADLFACLEITAHQQRQLEKILYALKAIHEQTEKIEGYFSKL